MLGPESHNTHSRWYEDPGVLPPPPVFPTLPPPIFRMVVVKQGDLAPQGPSGDVRRHCWPSRLQRGLVRRQLGSYSTQHSPLPKHFSDKKVCGAEMEDP